jgi:hypothetical protein
VEAVFTEAEIDRTRDSVSRVGDEVRAALEEGSKACVSWRLGPTGRLGAVLWRCAGGQRGKRATGGENLRQAPSSLVMLLLAEFDGAGSARVARVVFLDQGRRREAAAGLKRRCTALACGSRGNCGSTVAHRTCDRVLSDPGLASRRRAWLELACGVSGWHSRAGPGAAKWGTVGPAKQRRGETRGGRRTWQASPVGQRERARLRCGQAGPAEQTGGVRL